MTLKAMVLEKRDVHAPGVEEWMIALPSLLWVVMWRVRPGRLEEEIWDSLGAREDIVGWFGLVNLLMC